MARAYLYEAGRAPGGYLKVYKGSAFTYLKQSVYLSGSHASFTELM